MCVVCVCGVHVCSVYVCTCVCVQGAHVYLFQASCTDYHLILKVKQLVVWFCHTLKVRPLLVLREVVRARRKIKESMKEFESCCFKLKDYK